MVSRIKNTLRSLISQVALSGKFRENNGTIESISAQRLIVFQDPVLDSVSGLNMYEEVIKVKNFYTDKLGKDFNAKYQQEIEHYKFLHHGMLHQIRATKYFFNERLESRKNIIFSNDCISSIQIIDRPEEIRLYAHFRSSDLINLLPLDLLALTDILRKVIVTHEVNRNKLITMFCSFGSLHILPEDHDLAREIGEEAADLVYSEGYRDFNINDATLHVE